MAYKISTYLGFLFPLLLTNMQAEAQHTSLPKGVSVSFNIKNTILKDSIQPILEVTYSNKGKSTFIIYDSLEEGEMHAFYANLHADLLELKPGKGYVVLIKKIFTPHFYGLDDSLFRLNMMPLEPGRDTTLVYDLFDLFSYELAKGTYKLRFHLRIPPFKQMKPDEGAYYLTSKWFKLFVVETIRKRNWRPVHEDQN